MNNKFITICFILFAFFTVSVFAYSLQAAEKKDEIYPNFLLYNSTTACIQGVVQLIIRFNPTLKNQFIPPAIQQQLLGHCSCVIDRIRIEFTIQEYMKEINDYLWITKVWGKYGRQCMKAGYLAGVIEIPTDNETKEDTKVEDNKTESLEPKSKVEKIQNEEPIIFQG
jgi:hypothetical protein